MEASSLEAWDCSLEGAVGLLESLEPQAVRVRERRMRAGRCVRKVGIEGSLLSRIGRVVLVES